jgi:hypothetical protein
MTTLTTLDDLWLAVEQRPHEWNRWLVLADALNDAGDERTEHAVRWCAENGKRPVRRYNSAVYAFGDNSWPHNSFSRLPFRFCGHSVHIEPTFPDAIRWLAGDLEREGL